MRSCSRLSRWQRWNWLPWVLLIITYMVWKKCFWKMHKQITRFKLTGISGFLLTSNTFSCFSFYVSYWIITILALNNSLSLSHFDIICGTTHIHAILSNQGYCSDSEFLCIFDLNCINITLSCDGIYDCNDFSDEASCFG